jgi:hypothetical protein
MQLFARDLLGGKLVTVGGVDGGPEGLVLGAPLGDLAIEKLDFRTGPAQLEDAAVRKKQHPHEHGRDGERDQESGQRPGTPPDVLRVLHFGNAARPA